MTDKLIEKIIQTQNVSVVGLDTALSYLPGNLREKADSFKGAGEGILEFNKRIIDAVKDIVPAVKVQVAYYEMYSVEGMRAFYETIGYAKENGLIVISDVKRNDIGDTAKRYSSAYLGETELEGNALNAFPSDFVTLNGYLGSDGIKPFIEDMERFNKGAFILVKTSNKSSGELQDLKLENGLTVYEYMGSLVSGWGQGLIGKYGYSSVGAVVGATYKEQAEILRKQMPSTLFLVPGYGAQGGTAEDLSVCFDAKGLGAVVNSSRGIICAYKADRYKGKKFDEAARLAALDMKEDINGMLKNHNIHRVGG